MATRAFQQEVASWIVIDVEGQQSTNGWRARNDGEAKRVLAPELLLRQRFSWAQKVEAVDLRDQPKHRSSCSTLEEDFAAATVRLCPSALCKRPRAAGYRGSDFVRSHISNLPSECSVGLLWGAKRAWSWKVGDFRVWPIPNATTSCCWNY